MNTTADSPFTTSTENPATDKQRAFATKLIAEKAIDEEMALVWAELVASPEFTKKQASALIDALMAMPRKATPTKTDAAITAGVYRTPEGHIIKVQIGGSGHPYAKLLTVDGFEYRAGLVAKLTADMRMTLEQAAAYGRETGVCACCGRTLTHPDSVSRGVGPICAAGF